MTATLSTLQSYDLLLHLFDILKLQDHGRSLLASCARVCRAWQEPASYVLWRKLTSFHPLWSLLSKHNFSRDGKGVSAFWQYIDAEDFVKFVVEHESEKWERFLHRASHVREVGVAACAQSELALIRVLTKYNHGRTILPSLHRLSWRHAVPTETSVLLLCSPSLHELEVIVSRLGSESTGGSAFVTPQRFGEYRDVDPLFVGLPDAATSLRRLSITGRQGPGSAVVPSLIRNTRLRELYLYNQSLKLEPGHIRSLLEGLPDLELLFAHIYGFSHMELALGSASSQSLKELRLDGSSQDLQTAFSGFFDTPLLQSLHLEAVDSEHSPGSFDIIPLISSAPFARSLRAVSVTLRLDTAHFRPVPASFSALARPLFALQDLRDIRLFFVNSFVPFRDEDVREVARAWKHAESLHLAYAPSSEPTTRPPLTSLEHFAINCPRLQELSMTKLSIPETIEMPPVRSAHPLRSLDLKMTFAQSDGNGRFDRVLVAKYIDHLFPNIVLSEPDASRGRDRAIRVPPVFAWGNIEHQIRLLRSRRSG